MKKEKQRRSQSKNENIDQALQMEFDSDLEMWHIKKEGYINVFWEASKAYKAKLEITS